MLQLSTHLDGSTDRILVVIRCLLQGAQEADPVAFLPRDVLANAQICLNEVMSFVLDTVTEARLASIVSEGDVEIARNKLCEFSPENRYSVIVHHNELQSSQDFAAALKMVHPAIAVRSESSRVVGSVIYLLFGHDLSPI